MPRKRKTNEPEVQQAACAKEPVSDFVEARFGEAGASAFDAAFPDSSESGFEKDAAAFAAFMEKLRGAGFGGNPETALPASEDDPEGYWRRIFSHFAEQGKWGSASGLCELMRKSGFKAYAPYADWWRNSLSRALDLAPYGFSAVARSLSGSLSPIPVKDENGNITGAAFPIKSFDPLKLAFFEGSETMDFMTGYAVMWRKSAWDFIKTRMDFTTDFSMVGDLRKIYAESYNMDDKVRAWRLLNGRLEVLCGSESPFEAPDGMNDVLREKLPDFMPDIFLDLAALPSDQGAILAAGFRFGGNCAWAFADHLKMSDDNSKIMEKAMEMGRSFKSLLDNAGKGRESARKMLEKCGEIMDSQKAKEAA